MQVKQVPRFSFYYSKILKMDTSYIGHSKLRSKKKDKKMRNNDTLQVYNIFTKT